jgi:Arc/MetJ family transcription regulator
MKVDLMRVTVTIEDELLRSAKSVTGIENPEVLIETALRDLISHEAAKRLAALGGTMPNLRPIPRRRPPTGEECSEE